MERVYRLPRKVQRFEPSAYAGIGSAKVAQAHVQAAKVTQITSKNRANLDAPVPMIA
jgi:hypothetical protein